METAEQRQAHLTESKALLDAVMNEANLTNQGRGIDRIGELADNLDKLASSKALNVANARLDNFSEALKNSGMAEDATEAEVESYKDEIVNYLRELIREKL
jgi:hypothetical protein